MRLEKTFKKAHERYKIEGRSNQDRYKFFKHLVGKKHKKSYTRLAILYNRQKYYSENKQKHLTQCLLYQKSDKYKKYRRNYEASYRHSNRVMTNYNSWKSKSPRTEIEQINYLLKRFLNES